MFIDNYVPGAVEDQSSVLDVFAGRGFDAGLKRPYLDEKGRKCVTINTGRQEYRKNADGSYVCNASGVPVRFPVLQKRLVGDLMREGVFDPTWNATTSLRKEDWILMDKAVLRAARLRMRAWSDLAAANAFGGFNGMAKTNLEHEIMSDPGDAIVDMDGVTEGRADSPLFEPYALPLPITHSSYHFTQRRLAESRQSNTPLDLVMAEAAGRRVGETIEKMTIGVLDLSALTAKGNVTYTRAGIYGYTTHPDRITKTDLTTPTGVATGDNTVADVLAMRDLAYAQNFFGPFMLYHSDDWDQYLDNDYLITAGTSYGAAPSITLRDRLRRIDGIQDVRRLDYLTDTFTLLLVQMTPEVAQAVIGMDLTTVQWEAKGGLQLMFKVMAIMVPRIRAQYVGATTTKKVGIVHATTS